MTKKSRNTHAKALQVLVSLQKTLLGRLAEYVLDNEASLKQAADGAEGYGYSLHQLDEIFLSRLNLVERTIAELHKTPVAGGNRYRSMVFHAPRDEVEQEINSRLEKVPSARILGVTVSPASASSRVTYQFTEIAPPEGHAERETEGAAGPKESVARLVRSVIEDETPAVETGGEAADILDDLAAGLPDDLQGSPEDVDDDELLVTVLYYGPPLAADA